MYGNGNGFGVIAAGAAAHCKQQVNIIFARNFHAFAQFVRSRIRHNASVLDDIFAVRLENFDNRVINPVALDGAAAVNQLDGLAVLREFVVQKLQRIVAEIEFGRVDISKISKHFKPSRFNTYKKTPPQIWNGAIGATVKILRFFN